MPSSFAETVAPRWAWWGVVGVLVVLAGALAAAAVTAEGPGQVAIVLAIAAGTSAAAWAVTSLVLIRPRHAPDHLTADARGVLVPGSRRITAALLAAAVVWAGAFATIAAASDGGWRIASIVAAAGALAGALSKVRHLRPRWLRLTPEGLEASTYTGEATMRWEQVADVSYRQGHDGLMVFRLSGREGAGTLDVESATLDLDPYLLLMAIETYRRTPARRTELAGPVPPARLTDARQALAEIDGAGPLEFGPERRSLTSR